MIASVNKEALTELKTKKNEIKARTIFRGNIEQAMNKQANFFPSSSSANMNSFKNLAGDRRQYA